MRPFFIVTNIDATFKNKKSINTLKMGRWEGSVGENPAANPDDLSSVLRTHMAERENSLLPVDLDMDVCIVQHVSCLHYSMWNLCVFVL